MKLLLRTLQIYFPVFCFLLSHVIFCACMCLSGQVFCNREHVKIFNLRKKKCHHINWVSAEWLRASCTCLGNDFAGNAICLSAHLYFSSATSHPRMQTPCFKLQVFIIDFKVWQEGSASLGGDVDCLFFAVKRNISVVNISWCSYKHQETPTT